MARKKKNKPPINVSLEELSGSLKPGQRLLGLDLGTKTIGLALSDGSLMIATPLETIHRKKFTQDAEQMLAIIEANNVAGLLMGMPYNMDGTEGPRAQATRDFVHSFKEKCPLPVAFWDERLSTVAVTRTLLDADTSRSRRGEVVDKMAASYILQGALDRIKRGFDSPEEQSGTEEEDEQAN
ncbi:MAG: Holliday junction resolvase RuvX [Cohaesibacter sp.]|jgi:putative Holliday junction resolvase|nr:Holliday junction resolvase RuvX [Cohaesibacter sp.]